jgi:hypothetical protein
MTEKLPLGKGPLKTGKHRIVWTVNGTRTKKRKNYIGLMTSAMNAVSYMTTATVTNN